MSPKQCPTHMPVHRQTQCPTQCSRRMPLFSSPLLSAVKPPKLNARTPAQRPTRELDHAGRHQAATDSAPTGGRA